MVNPWLTLRCDADLRRRLVREARRLRWSVGAVVRTILRVALGGQDPVKRYERRRR